MKFTATLLAVRDMDRSLKFYKDLFGEEVICDLGWNKTLTCGLTLQLNFARIGGFPEEKMRFFNYDMELYFETEDIDAFAEKLRAYPEVRYLNELMEHPWHQRVIRLFDPDGHIIEVGESMRSVAFREFGKGHTAEETAKIIQHPLQMVNGWYGEYQKRGEGAGR